MLSLFCFYPVGSCTRVTDLKPEGEGNIVVYCILTRDASQTLFLSMTDISTEEAMNGLKEAKISLFDETESTNVGSFVCDGDGSWSMGYLPVFGHEYRLIIVLPGRDSVTARTTMPASLCLKHILHDYAYEPPYWHQRPPYDEEDSTGFFENGIKFPISSLPKGPIWVMGMNYDADSRQHVMADIIATSLYSVDGFNVTGESYHFKDIFGFEPIHWHDPEFPGYGRFVPSLDNGHTLYRYVEGHPLHKQCLRILSVEEGERYADDRDNCFSISGSFSGNYLFHDKPSPTDGYLLFMAPSMEYDRFLKEIIIYEERVLNSTDYSVIFDRENLYTNITNGTGIFGAKVEQVEPWNKEVLYEKFKP